LVNPGKFIFHFVKKGRKRESRPRERRVAGVHLLVTKKKKSAQLGGKGGNEEPLREKKNLEEKGRRILFLGGGKRL